MFLVAAVDMPQAAVDGVHSRSCGTCACCQCQERGAESKDGEIVEGGYEGSEVVVSSLRVCRGEMSIGVTD